ncbi:MAG: xanthine dehydrogenase small subunit [Rhodospirillaceae bacterium]|nr:xanthine dehydrogenase small subunit [Rhodospirillaceae bacterium]|tara:strand:- start:138 stop:1532 length:1395 start_codon:yes stop_codon:yes gene_type:complete
MLRLTINGKLHDTGNASPTMTLLEYIRSIPNLTGTKEGCAEGDCGACTVVRVANNKFQAVNSCLLQLGQVGASEIITVEGIKTINGGELSPIQECLAGGGGTQCGFCTPGFVMALFALGQSAEEKGDWVIHDALAGNLCRCTGYRPIVDAARVGCMKNISYERHAIEAPPYKYRKENQTFYMPKSLNELVSLREAVKGAMLLSGGTDLGLSISKDRVVPENVIYTGHVFELREIVETKGELIVGAAVTYTEALEYIKRLFPSFEELIRRIGSRQIRNLGTIGGNIGNASPIGDTLPCLISLDASLTLASAEGEREVPIEDYFVGYRETCLKSNEVIKNIKIPTLLDNQMFRTYKVSKRYDQDISSVIGAYRLTIKNSRITNARVAYGGLAPRPCRAKKTELAMERIGLDEDEFVELSKQISSDFQPISDHRASAKYRTKIAANLLIRLYRDLFGSENELEVVKV